MREVISIQIGQAGAQVGAACWSLYCLEHAIEVDGRLRAKDPHEPHIIRPLAPEEMHTYFSETPDGQMVSRTLFLDLDPTVVDEVANIVISSQLIVCSAVARTQRVISRVANIPSAKSCFIMRSIAFV
jgi:hypothetical protein